MGADVLITAASRRTKAAVDRLPGALTKSKDSNIFKILYSFVHEEEILRSVITSVREKRDIITLTEEDPMGYTPHIDLFSAPMMVKRLDKTPTQKESNASYRTRLIAERHSRLSDGSVGDIANYVYALSGLSHPAVGYTLEENDSGLITGINYQFSKEEFKIYEGWQYEDLDQKLCFWIEFLEVPIYPFNLDQAQEGMRQIKAAGVCFKGFIFNCIKETAAGLVIPEILVSTDDSDIEVGAVNCIKRVSSSMRWGPDPWGNARWGFAEPEQCANSCWFFLLLPDTLQVNVDQSPKYDAEYSYLLGGETPLVQAEMPLGTCMLEFAPLPTSLAAGGSFFEIEGYGDRGYNIPPYNFYRKDPIITSWYHVLVDTGLSNPRRPPYTSEELAGLEEPLRSQKQLVSQKGWISLNGHYEYIPWRTGGKSTPWGKTCWNLDFDLKQRENDSLAYIVINMYCPTTWLTVDYPAPHIRCPRPVRPQVDVECLFEWDDRVLFTLPNSGRPTGVSVETEWITF